MKSQTPQPTRPQPPKLQLTPRHPVKLQLTTQQLDYLVAVADAPTWADAAVSLGVTPSALSQGLTELERRLGIPLFERVGRRRVIATSVAPVVDYARSVMAQTGDLGRWIASTRGGSIGSLRLGMIDAAAVHHFSDELLQFRLARPEVSFDLHVAPSGELLRQLTADELDVAIAVRPSEQPPSLDFTVLMTEPLAIYAPTAPAGADQPSPVTAPADRWGPWVFFPTTSHTRQLIDAALSALGAPIDTVAESNQPDVLREMVRLGLGWTVLPVVQAETGEQPLQRVRPEPLLERTLVIARRRGAIANVLVDELLELLRSDGHWQS